MLTHFGRCGALLVALLLAACDGGGGGFTQQPGGYAEFREGEAVRRFRGQWPLPGGAGTVSRAQAFLGNPPVQLGLPTGVSIGAGQVVGRRGETVVFGLEGAGMLIDGAEIRVHTIREWVVAITIRAPSMLVGSNVPIFPMADAVALVASRESGLEMRGAPELRFAMPDMLVGEDAIATLHWRVALDDTIGHRPRVYWVDANDGDISFIEPLVAGVVSREVWDCNGAASESSCREERTNRTFRADDVNPTVPDPSPDALRAHEIALASCNRWEATFSDDVACDPNIVFTEFGAVPGYAAAQEGMLYFGPGALDGDDGVTRFEHELMHATQYHHADLHPVLEPGAVNEAYADVMAMFATRPPYWLVRNADGDIVRDLQSPSMTMQPSRYDARRTLGETWSADESNDFGEVHANSTILSHALWIAAIDGVNVAGVSYPGIGVEKLEQILYIAMSEYSGRLSTLRQAADDLAAACNREAATRLIYETTVIADHWYITAHDCGVLRNALAEVGLLEEDRDLDSWEDSADVCPNHYNPLQLRDPTSGVCLDQPPIDVGDAGPGDYDGGPILSDFPEMPTELPTCPAMMAFNDRAFPPVTITLDSQSDPTCIDCSGGRGAGYAVTCRYLQAPDMFYEVQLLWMPHDRAMVRVDDSTGPSNHEHCGAADRVWTVGGSGGGTAYSNTHSAVVFTSLLPSAGASDEERDILYFILDQLEMISAPCP